MEFLRSKHPTMAQVLEVVLGEIGIALSDTNTSTTILPIISYMLSRLITCVWRSQDPCKQLDLAIISTRQVPAVCLNVAVNLLGTLAYASASLHRKMDIQAWKEDDAALSLGCAESQQCSL